MSDPKSNLQTLRSLTENLCGDDVDAQCGKCQLLFHKDDGVVTELSRVKDELKNQLKIMGE